MYVERIFGTIQGARKYLKKSEYRLDVKDSNDDKNQRWVDSDCESAVPVWGGFFCLEERGYKRTT